MVFRNRIDAGRQLAERLMPYAREDCLVLGLPRGGVVVAYEVAKILGKPLDVLVVRKLGAPGHSELAIGAIGPNDVLVLNHVLIENLGLSRHQVEECIRRETVELAHRLRRFRGDRPFPALAGQTVILVDDGLATGASARAAVQAVRAMRAGKIILGVPVGAYSSAAHLRSEVDELVCLDAPQNFDAVSRWYSNFDQTSDVEVIDLLEDAWGNHYDSSVKSRTIGPP